ncbi:uncharacterized protein LOC132934792 isoform X2 [Metopolophium dirhodum]|uniref:uncharacterized protein LOC132934792 isoform X2 n=1 Tax=Metopolophium dirhodum TaxID=44670 RepID=UPI00298F98BF|nr:uncharacterized protein LOC132934792 isoform X2 [Metopolophium dirhodum]
MGNSKKLHKSGSAKRKKKEKEMLRKEGQNPNQKKLNFVKSSDNNLKKCSSSVIENERENLNNDNDVNSSKQDIKDIENVDTMAIVETCSNIDNGDSNLKKYNSTAIENERENLNSDNDNEKNQVNTIENVENVDTMEIVKTCSNIDNEATDMFIKPRSINFTSFWSFHPHQPKTNIPFRPSKLYNRKDGGHRKWISYCVKKKALFCNICLCYGDKSGSFSKEFSVWKHVYERVSDHEETVTQKLNVDAHLMKKQFSSVDSLLTHGLGSIRKIQVENNRNVLLCLIDVLKLIGKRGLSYRGKTNEAAYSLDDSSLDHGNFLEITFLISKYDSLLKSHLDKVVKKSLKCHNSEAQQGGGQVTFLSKTTINYIIEIIAKNIKFTISNEVKDAVIYSVQLDTTQDISVTDQCSIILRYVNGTSVFERLVGKV